MSHHEASDLYRVATAQGKHGIWLLTFPDRENTGNLVNLIFYTGKIVATQGKFLKFRIFGSFGILPNEPM